MKIWISSLQEAGLRGISQSLGKFTSQHQQPRQLSLALILQPPSPYIRRSSVTNISTTRRMLSSSTSASLLNRLVSIRNHLAVAMNATEIKHFLADSPPSTVNLVIKKHFDALSDKEKRYAHYISKWVYNIPSLISGIGATKLYRYHREMEEREIKLSSKNK